MAIYQVDNAIHRLKNQQGLFLDTFYDNFSRENGISATSMNAFETIRYHKGKRNVIKTNKLSSLGL